MKKKAHSLKLPRSLNFNIETDIPAIVIILSEENSLTIQDPQENAEKLAEILLLTINKRVIQCLITELAKKLRIVSPPIPG